MRLKRGPGIFGRSGSPLTWTSIYGADDGPASLFGMMTDQDWHRLGRSHTGTRVNERTALTYSVLWACVTLIADAVSSLPPEAVIDPGDGSEIQPAPLPTWIRKPHPELRRNEVWNQLLISLLLWGNGYALIVRRPSDGVIIGLRPLLPSRVHCEWEPTDGRAGYRRYQIDGGPWVTSNEVFHVMGPAMPGDPYGMSVVRQAREAIALGLTLEEFGARYFSQGSMAKVVLKIPNKQLSTEQARDIVNMYERFHRGPGNWHRPAVLSGGGEIQNISIPPEDSQFLQSREFQALEIARWFRVPPHRLAIMTKQSSWGSGLAEENTAMVQHTFRPWIMRFEAAFTAYAPGGEDSGIRIRLVDASLLRGSFQEQVTAWSEAVGGPIATPNEGRKALSLGPIKGGDKLVSNAPAPPKPPPDANKAGNQDPSQEGNNPNDSTH